MRLTVFILIFIFLLAVPVAWPGIDVCVSGLFYRAGTGFYLANNPVFVALHDMAYYGARALGAGFAFLALYAFLRHSEFLRVDGKGWLFLLLALLIGPGLVANVGFKDHWGRARPREVIELGGTGSFTPFYQPRFQAAHANGSFVSGDGAFGFFLPAFAFVAPRKSSRRVFWGMMAAGGLFGFVRLAMGAHFLSDILYAAAFMLAVTSALHAAMYGRRETAARWRGYFTPSSGD